MHLSRLRLLGAEAADVERLHAEWALGLDRFASLRRARVAAGIPEGLTADDVAGDRLKVAIRDDRGNTTTSLIRIRSVPGTVLIEHLVLREEAGGRRGPSAPSVPEVVRHLLEEPRTEPSELRRMAVSVGVEGVAKLVEHALDPRREEPIVLVSVDNGLRTPLLAPQSLALALAGMASVWSLDTVAASRALKEALIARGFTEKFGCYNGGIRILWPGIGTDDDPYDHLLLLPLRLYNVPESARADHVAAIFAEMMVEGEDPRAWIRDIERSDAPPEPAPRPAAPRADRAATIVRRPGSAKGTEDVATVVAPADVRTTRREAAYVAPKRSLPTRPPVAIQRPAAPPPATPVPAEPAVAHGTEPIATSSPVEPFELAPTPEIPAAVASAAVLEVVPLPIPELSAPEPSQASEPRIVPPSTARAEMPPESPATPEPEESVAMTRPISTWSKLGDDVLAALDLAAELERDLDRTRRELVEAGRAVRRAEQERDELSQHAGEFRGPAEALAEAGRRFDEVLVVLPSATSAAESSGYRDPERVFRVLALLALFGRNDRRFELALGDALGNAARCKPRNSPQTVAAFGIQRTFIASDGRPKLFARHVTLGHGVDSSKCLQVYYDILSDGRIEIGWCGEHRPTVSVNT